MARQRRGGFRPPELKGTLGTLLRTTLQQAGAMREVLGDVLDRGAREGRARFEAFTDRSRSERRSPRDRQDTLADLGELVLDLIRRGEIDLDELPEARDLVENLDAMDAEEGDAPDEPVFAPSRARFDARGPGAPSRDRDEDGTVSSGRWAPPRAKPAAAQRVWRPTAADIPEPAGPPAARAPSKSAAPKGGITFEDDDDLAEYMHPDDVPPKGENK